MANTLSGERIDETMLPPVIFRRWRHSFEEDTSEVQVYRPENFPFPAAHGRDGFTMRPDGRFIQEDIGPADEPVLVPGHWTLLAPRHVAVRFTDPARPGFSFLIVDVSDEVLRIHRVTKHVGPTPGGLTTVDDAALAAFGTNPPPSSLRLIDFREAKVLALRQFPGRYALQVSGTVPVANMTVSLVPLVYVKQPEFWEIEVIGALPEITLPAEAPYSVTIPLAGSLGTCGIEVVGANKRERFDLFCGASA